MHMHGLELESESAPKRGQEMQQHCRIQTAAVGQQQPLTGAYEIVETGSQFFRQLAAIVACSPFPGCRIFGWVEPVSQGRMQPEYT